VPFAKSCKCEKSSVKVNLVELKHNLDQCNFYCYSRSFHYQIWRI